MATITKKTSKKNLCIKPWHYINGKILFPKPAVQKELHPTGWKNITQSHYWTKFMDEVKDLFEKVIAFYEEASENVSTASTLDTFLSENSEDFIVSDEFVQSVVFSSPSLEESY